jgi:DNA-binding CsgD family transcriptional regulator
MTRSEIREAIKKVFFEEIEPDSLTKKTNQHTNPGYKRYRSLDKKHRFRSQHEVLAYNIFDKEGIVDQIESEAYRFKKTCNKIPDFVWESKKIIIEVAGMDDKGFYKSGPTYTQKLKKAKKCFEKQGYTVYIIDTRQNSIYYNYVKFYEHLGDLLGFTLKPEIKDDIFSYIGDPIDIIKRNQKIIQYYKHNKQYIKDNKITYQDIGKNFNPIAEPKEVFRILKQAGFTALRPLTPDQYKTRKEKIIDFIEQNQEDIKNNKITYQDIANKFNTSKETINNLAYNLGFSTPKSEIQSQADALKEKIIQYYNNNKEDIINNKISYTDIGKIFNVSQYVVFNALKAAELTNLKTQTPAQYKAQKEKIIQYFTDNLEDIKNTKPQKKAFEYIANLFSTPENKLSLEAVRVMWNIEGFADSKDKIQTQRQSRRQEILDFVNKNKEAIKNRTITRQNIIDKFKTSATIVDSILKQAELTTPVSQTQARNQEVAQYRKDNPKATGQQIADKFNITIPTVKYILRALKKSNPTNEQSLNNKTMTLKELREIIKKAMQESTIDVPGDPNKLTPQQKSAEISKARRTTRKPKLGTSEDPIDFI